MQILINTDHHIKGHEPLNARVKDAVAHTLQRYSEQISRVEVHLGDQSGKTNGPHDHRCMMEARLQGRAPIAVTHEAKTLDQAVDGAASKLQRLIGDVIGRQRDQKTGHKSQAVAEPPEAEEER